MKAWTGFFLALLLVAAVVCVGGAFWIHRGFRARSKPTVSEAYLARKIRNFAIPTSERHSKNTIGTTPENLRQARELFIEHCASCHGLDGGARTQLGENLYPRVPDLRATLTQSLSDGELHYIIENGVQLTGMPAFTDLHEGSPRGAWLLVLYVRNLVAQNQAQKSQQAAAGPPAHFVGSQACAKCHAEIYARWKKTPMANVVRDPREHPEAIIPDLKTNHVAPFTKEQVALVYGRLWKRSRLHAQPCKITEADLL